MMDAAKWARLKEWFGEALDSPGDTHAIVARAERESAELGAELRALLKEHQHNALAAGSVLAQAPGRIEIHPEAAGPEDVGPYKILRELGRGGTGIVLLAERRDDEFHRKVALKVLRYVAWDEGTRDLLLRERRILSGMQHPNVAALVDWGETADGAQWIATEYVEGEPIDRYCRSRSLGVDATLGIFEQVCQAVQYAHRRLVVHRDLKPQNILVADGALVKLLDFGISKPLSDSTVTAVVERRFTPAYASPEQITGGPITSATDVYALGLLLYELLAGEPPFPAATVEDMTRRLDDKPPLPPSRVTGLPRARQRTIAGDLDFIVLHALERDPEHRYQSIEQLLADLGRFRTGYPLLASRPGLAHRARKFARRHALPIGAGVLAASALIGGAAVAVNSARVARREQQIAERRFRDLQELAHSVIYDLHDSIRQVPQSMEARRLLATTAVKYLDGLAQENNADDSLQLEVASGYMRMAYAQGGVMGANVGDTKGSLHSYQTALRILEQLAGRHPEDAQVKVLLIGAAYNLSMLLNNPPEGLAMAVRYSAVAEQFAAAYPMSASWQAVGLMNAAQGRILRNLGRHQDSLAALDRAAAAQEKTIETASTANRQQPMWTASVELVQALFDRGLTAFAHAQTLIELQEFGEAYRSIDRARALFDRSARMRTPPGPSDSRMYARTRALQAFLLLKLGRRDEAWSEIQTALAAGESSRSDGTATSRRDFAETNRYAGAILLARQDLPAALFHYRRAAEVIGELVDSDQLLVLNRVFQAGILIDYGDALQASGQRKSARAAFEQAEVVIDKAWVDAPGWASLPAERVRARQRIESISKP